MEIKGMFACGLEYEGQRHRSFTLRLPTMAAVENAIEAVQCELSRNLRISVTKLENGARHFSAVGTVIA